MLFHHSIGGAANANLGELRAELNELAHKEAQESEIIEAAWAWKARKEEMEELEHRTTILSESVNRHRDKLGGANSVTELLSQYTSLYEEKLPKLQLLAAEVPLQAAASRVPHAHFPSERLDAGEDLPQLAQRRLEPAAHGGAPPTPAPRAFLMLLKVGDSVSATFCTENNVFRT